MHSGDLDVQAVAHLEQWVMMISIGKWYMYVRETLAGGDML